MLCAWPFPVWAPPTGKGVVVKLRQDGRGHMLNAEAEQMLPHFFFFKAEFTLVFFSFFILFYGKPSMTQKVRVGRDL